MKKQLLPSPSPSALLLGAALLELELISGPVRIAPLRVAIAIPLVLYLPGAALQRALLSVRHDTWAERTAAAVGMSLASVAIGGLVLNLFATGIRPVTWLLYLAVLAVLAEMMLYVRAPVFVAASPSVFRLPAAARLATGALIAAVLSCAVAIAILGAHRQISAGFAQLWLLPHGGAGRYELGVASFTRRRNVYRIRLEINGRPERDWAPITLASGGDWRVLVAVPVHAFARALLYRNDSTGIYRQVYIRDAAP